MHELSAAQRILDTALTEARKAGASSILRVNLKLGELSTFDAGCLRQYFGIISKETQAEGASLDVEHIPVKYECGGCGSNYVPNLGEIWCPACSSKKGKLVGGMEFYIESVEVK